MQLVVVRSKVYEFVARLSQVTDGHASSLLDELRNRLVLVVRDVNVLATIVQHTRQSAGLLQVANPINNVLKRNKSWLKYMPYCIEAFKI